MSRGARPGAAARRARGRAAVLTLLTDFGTQDAYVGIMKGVALGICPAARLVDLTHAVPPQAVAVGALALRSAVPYFPAGTVHCAVVDPGVGSARRAVAVRAAGALLVGPDNGLLAPAVAKLGGADAVHAIENAALCRSPVSRTFHGRDVFAPVAAHLAAGAALAEVGPPLAALAPLALPAPRVEGDTVHGAVIYVDRFGNLLTNIDRAALSGFRARTLSVRLPSVIVPLVSTYSEVAPGEALALWSSWETVEIAVRDGNAAVHLGAGIGTAVAVGGE